MCTVNIYKYNFFCLYTITESIVTYSANDMARRKRRNVWKKRDIWMKYVRLNGESTHMTKWNLWKYQKKKSISIKTAHSRNVSQPKSLKFQWKRNETRNKNANILGSIPFCFQFLIYVPFIFPYHKTHLLVNSIERTSISFNVNHFYVLFLSTGSYFYSSPFFAQRFASSFRINCS